MAVLRVGGRKLAVRRLQKTAGREQIHRIHGFPHSGTVPKTRACGVTPLRGTLRACAEASVSSRLAPDPAQRKQSQSATGGKCISQGKRGRKFGTRKPAPRGRPLGPPRRSWRVLSLVQQRRVTRRHGTPCPRGASPPPAATCARGPLPWRPPRWWPNAPRVPGRPWHCPRPPWALSRWCCPRATPGPRSAGRGPGRAG